MAIRIGEDGTIINGDEVISSSGTIIRDDGTIESSNIAVSNRAVFLGHLHVEQPFECGSLSAIHLAQDGRQGIELIEIAFMSQMDMEERKAVVFKEFPSRLIAGSHLELVQRIQKAVVGSGELQLTATVLISG